MSHFPRLNIDALIFSRNDVLFDVRPSYHQVAARTVQLYLEQAVGLAPATEPLLTPEEVARLYYIGKFSGYLDVTTALLIYFIELLPPVPSPTFPAKFHIPAFLAYLHLAGKLVQVGVDDLRRQKDVEWLARQIVAAGGGLSGADAALPRVNRHLLVDEGDITRANLVGRFFQELYLGTKLFAQVYGEPAMLVSSDGYIQQETLLIDRDILAQLADRLPLALIADGCPRAEVEHTLHAQQVRPYFQLVITLDDLRQARANPIPDAWPLLEAARLLRPTPVHIGFVGASPADIHAARAANRTVPFTAIGTLAAAPDKSLLKQALEAAKANIIIGHPDHLKELILG